MDKLKTLASEITKLRQELETDIKKNATVTFEDVYSLLKADRLSIKKMLL